MCIRLSECQQRARQCRCIYREVKNEHDPLRLVTDRQTGTQTDCSNFCVHARRALMNCMVYIRTIMQLEGIVLASIKGALK